jgi:DNA-binding MarR family transcriptional regulator
VVPLRPLKKMKLASEEKWGAEVMALGFCILPSLLMKAQARLKLNPTHLAILVHLADFWWRAEGRPRPSKVTVADRLGLKARTVQRHVAELEELGLSQRIERRGANQGKRANFYDLSGLVARLKELAPEFREIEEKAKEARARVARPGLRRRAAAAAE